MPSQPPIRIRFRATRQYTRSVALGIERAAAAIARAANSQSKLNGTWRVKAQHLLPLIFEVKQAAGMYREVTYDTVPGRLR